MIHFGIDNAGFDNKLICATVNFFDGWVFNPDITNPIIKVCFFVDDSQIGFIPVKTERPDLVKAFHETLLGFHGICDIPETCLNKTLMVYAVAQDGSAFFMQQYELADKLSQEEKDFRINNALPDDILMHLVVHSVDPKSFLEEGNAAAELIKSILGQNGIDLLSIKNILDFGVGCGRVIRWWQEYSKIISFWGCDINPDLIAWCANNLEFGNYSVNNLQPPTIYNDAQFDLVYLFSVFTHLTIETQKKWLDEFSRILIPGGMALISVHGDFHAKYLPEESYQVYKEKGYYVLTKNAEGENLCASYENREFCENLFSKNFRILNYSPGALKSCGNQDLYVLRNKQ